MALQSSAVPKTEVQSQYPLVYGPHEVISQTLRFFTDLISSAYKILVSNQYSNDHYRLKFILNQPLTFRRLLFIFHFLRPFFLQVFLLRLNRSLPLQLMTFYVLR